MDKWLDEEKIRVRDLIDVIDTTDKRFYTLRILNVNKNSIAVAEEENMKFFNLNIKSNFEQVQAMLNIIDKSSFPYPYILYGPPGTGKTATIVESICQIVMRNPGNNIHVCAPSNLSK